MNHRHPRLVRRTHLSKINHQQSPPKEASWFDVWLPRLSHLSQFGLFLFTVATIYFTVIPLYQKALLEEAIAKKEIELKEATSAVAQKEQALASAQEELAKNTAALNEAKKSLEQAELKTYVQRRSYDLGTFIAFSSADCTGLLIPLGGDELESKRPEAYEEIFQLDSAECLQKAFQKSPLMSILKLQDLELFQSELLRTMGTLRSIKSKTLKESSDLPEAAKLDPTRLRPPGSFSARADAFLARFRILDPLPPEEKKRQDFERAITWTRNVLSREYAEAMRQEISRLRRVAWPINVQQSTS